MRLARKVKYLLFKYFHLRSASAHTNPPLDEFSLPGTINLHDSPDYRSLDFIERFSPTFQEFKDTLEDNIYSGACATYYKYGDGDYYFLKGEANGSAKPGKRALSKSYAEIDLPRFQQGSLTANYYMCEIPDVDRVRFQSTFEGKSIDYPAEYVYAAVASRWFFQKFDGRIGLIGAAEKIDLIDMLLQFEPYRKYLGVVNDVDLVRIPQKFACDDLDKTINMISEQLVGKSADLFLFGVGHVKSGIIEQLPLMHKATYVDVGSGIDALAGVIDIRRPYFGDWVNFQLPDQTVYENIDWLQVQNRGKRYFLNASS